MPVGIFGTVWAYRRLRETSVRGGGRMDWWGNLTFAGGLGSILVGVTYGIQPYGGHTMGWANPLVIATIAGGAILLALFVVIETRIAEPMFNLGLFKIRAFTAGSAAGFLAAIARGGLQLILVIWLQGIWLPLHGYSFIDTPLWAGIYMLPLSAAFLIAGPLCGNLSDRYGSRGLATGGMLIFCASFIGLMLLPVNFDYWAFGALIFANGIGVGMFSSPNSSSIMGSVPAAQRGAASGMRATFQNTGTALSIGIFFSLMVGGLSGSLPEALSSGLTQNGVAPAAANQIANLPPVSSLFAAFLGVNPIGHLLSLEDALAPLSHTSRAVLTGKHFFPELIAAPFHDGLVIVFGAAAALAAIAAAVSWQRPRREDPSTAITKETPDE